MYTLVYISFTSYCNSNKSEECAISVGGNCGKHSLNSCWRMIQMMEMDGIDMYP